MAEPPKSPARRAIKGRFDFRCAASPSCSRRFAQELVCVAPTGLIVVDFRRRRLPPWAKVVSLAARAFQPRSGGRNAAHGVSNGSAQVER